MATQILHGHTGTDHLTAARQAEINKALWGDDSVVFKVGSELDITIEAGTGTVTIADGVFSFNGVLGVVETSDTATYVKPASDTIYAKIGVAVRYTKDSGTQVEALDIVCLKSAETASVALTQAETIDYGDGEIGSAITEAYYPLYEFIANASGYSNLESFVNKVDTIPAIAADLAADLAAEVAAEATARANADTSERTARVAADTALQNNINALTWTAIAPGLNEDSSYTLSLSTYRYYNLVFFNSRCRTYHNVRLDKTKILETDERVIVTGFANSQGTSIYFLGFYFDNKTASSVDIVFEHRRISATGGVEITTSDSLELSAVYGSNTLIP